VPLKNDRDFRRTLEYAHFVKELTPERRCESSTKTWRWWGPMLAFILLGLLETACTFTELGLGKLVDRWARWVSDEKGSIHGKGCDGFGSDWF